MKKIILGALIIFTTQVYAIETALVTCTAKDTTFTIETRDYINKIQPNKNYLTVKVGNVLLEFKGEEIRRLQKYPISAVVDDKKSKILYYVLSEEIRTGRYHKGRILFLIKKRGLVSKTDSRGFDAICEFLSN